MNKDSKVGFVLSLDQAIKFFEACIEAEKAMGEPLTLEEKDALMSHMMKGSEVTLEDLRDVMAGKKILRVTHGKDDSTKA